MTILKLIKNRIGLIIFILLSVSISIISCDSSDEKARKLWNVKLWEQTKSEIKTEINYKLRTIYEECTPVVAKCSEYKSKKLPIIKGKIIIWDRNINQVCSLSHYSRQLSDIEAVRIADRLESKMLNDYTLHKDFQNSINIGKEALRKELLSLNNITIFVIINVGEGNKIGWYSGHPNFRAVSEHIEVCMIYWPEKNAVGKFKITVPPPNTLKVPDNFGSRSVNISGNHYEYLAGWINRLPRN